MGVAVAIIVFGIVFVVIAFMRSNTGGANSWATGGGAQMQPGFRQIFGGGYYAPYDKLVQNGTPAKGILLSVSSMGQRAGIQGRPFQTRAVTIDIEIPGQEPYTINATPLIPLNLVGDVLPGATVELRLDPSTGAIAIIGPGVGFAQQGLRTS